jgi:hypothetical protein
VENFCKENVIQHLKNKKATKTEKKQMLDLLENYTHDAIPDSGILFPSLLLNSFRIHS